jgi:hypothetical protein
MNSSSGDTLHGQSIGHSKHELVLRIHSAWPEPTTLDTGSDPFFTIISTRTYPCSNVSVIIVVGKSALRLQRSFGCLGCGLKTNAKCSICGCDSGGNEQLYRLCYNAIYSAESPATLRKNFPSTVSVER